MSNLISPKIHVLFILSEIWDYCLTIEVSVTTFTSIESAISLFLSVQINIVQNTNIHQPKRK